MEQGRTFFSSDVQCALTFRPSKKPSIISQYFALAVASAGPNDLSTAVTEELNT